MLYGLAYFFAKRFSKKIRGPLTLPAKVFSYETVTASENFRKVPFSKIDFQIRRIAALPS